MAQGRRKHPRAAVTEVGKPSETDKKADVEPQSSEVGTALYGVAMLKVAMELKKPNPLPLDDILTSVLTRMRIDENAFRRYLMNNGGLLRAIATRKQS